jgi:hypothetical protein
MEVDAMNWTVVGPILTAIASLIGVYMSNRKSAAVMELRMRMLEEKVNKHNTVIERMLKLEQKVEDIEKRLG